MKPYPKYRDSGVEWIGRIPEGWEVVRLKFVVKIRYGLGQPPRQLDNGLPMIRATNVARGKIVENDLMFVDPNDVPYDRDPILKTNDIIVVRSGAYTADSAIIPDRFDGAVSGYDMVVRAHKISPHLLAYEFLSDFVRVRQLYLHRLRAAQPHLNAEELGDTLIMVPPVEEQLAIAACLDRKTAQIDELIAKKRRLIELLAEERTAVIDQAVTKGLDQSVKMKDSGVEWLGKVPEHWELRRIKYLTRILRGKFTHRPRNDPRMYGGPYPFIQTGDIASANKYVSEYHQTLSHEGYEVSKEFPKGTLVMTIAANVGDVAILGFQACFPDSIVGFLPINGVELNYLHYLFNGMRMEFLRTAPMNTQLNLNIDRIGSLVTILPPSKEQTAIANYLDHRTAQIDQTISKTEEQINLLQEYRTALISEVVTGKIDVREEVTA